MAAIIPMRNINDRAVIQDWLITNVKYTDYLIDRVSLTFINDDDATAFCLQFGIQTATQNPELLNRTRG